jgi:hypothetical protein
MEAEKYRQRAERFLAQARSAPDATLRAGLIDLAARWMALAERAEALDCSELVWQQHLEPTQSSAQES